MTPEFITNIKRNNVRQRRIFLSKNKSRNSGVLHGNNTIRRAKRQKVTQSSLRVRNPGREATLIKTVKRSKVPRIVRTKRWRHNQDSTLQQLPLLRPTTPSRRALTRQERDEVGHETM